MLTATNDSSRGYFRGDNHAAYSLRREERLGSLETGKQADLTVFDVEDYREIPYYLGVNKCWMTVKNGEVIYRRSHA